MIVLEFDIFVFKEDKTYVAYSPVLDISSCGNSVDHAKDILKTAVRLFLEEVDKMETLEDILEESGYSKDPIGHWIPPKLVATELVSIA